MTFILRLPIVGVNESHRGIFAFARCLNPRLGRVRPVCFIYCEESSVTPVSSEETSSMRTNWYLTSMVFRIFR